jgi:hypothetical protein
MAIRRTGLSWAVWDSLGGKLHLAAKLVQKRKDYSHNLLYVPPLLKGKRTGEQPLSAMRSGYTPLWRIAAILTRPISRTTHLY